MRYAVLTLLWALGTTIPAFPASQGWTVYRHSAHDCRVEYASSLFTKDAWDAAKELQRFSGPDAQTYFRVSGTANDERLTPGDLKARYLDSDAPGQIVYERTKPEFLVLSGYRGNSIFYVKAALSADNRTICVLEMSYPRKAKKAFDEVVTRMSRSFVVERD